MGLRDHDRQRPEEAIRRAAEHVNATRERLRQGAAEIERQRGAIADTAEHLDGMSRWFEETERQLGNTRRDPRTDPGAP